VVTSPVASALNGLVNVHEDLAGQRVAVLSDHVAGPLVQDGQEDDVTLRTGAEGAEERAHPIPEPPMTDEQLYEPWFI
jgi:hypothetical protein